MAAGDANGNVNLWDLGSLRKLDSWQAIPGQITSLEFSPDGGSILVSGEAPGPNSSILGFLRIERASGSHDIVLDLHPSFAVLWSTFGPGGKTVASSFYIPPRPDAPSLGGWLVWDASTGELLLKRTDYPTSTNQVAYSPDGSKLAFVGSDRRTQSPKAVAIIVDLPTGRVERQFEVGTIPPGLAVDFSPDGTMIATGAWDGHAQLWDVATGRQIGKSMKASAGAVTSVRFSTDGRQIVTGGTDGTTRLFDVATQQQIGSEFPLAGQGGWVFAAFTPDGSSIVVNFSSGWSNVWPATVEGWAQHACAVARRSFSRAEWGQFVPGHPYEKVCPGGSSS